MWIVTVLAHLFSNTGYNTILRHAVFERKIDSFFLAAVLSSGIAAPALVGIFISKINWHLFDAHIVFIYAISILATIFLHVFNAKALEITAAGVFSFLFNFRIGFVTLFGITFLGEEIVPYRIAGGALVFVAGLIIAGKSTTTLPSIFYSILAATMLATVNTTEKYLIDAIGYTTYVFPSALIICGLLWLSVFIKKTPIDKDFLKTHALKALLAFRCVSAYGFTISLGLGALISVTTYISSLNCVTTPLAAVIFLKERDNLVRKAVAGIVALSGVTLIFVTAGL